MIKKHIPLIAALLIISTLIILYEKKELPFNENLNIEKEYKILLNRSKSENKNILIEFGANWCMDCSVFNDILTREPNLSYLNANYLILKVDVGKFDRNLEFSKKFEDPIQSGIPAIVILSSEEKILVSTNNGEFSNSRGLKDITVLDFFKKWKK
ncbi:MAG: thioredoxin family protein [Leptospiraceae bacterium]|nr:thioredoxin family protein [Leptospiraceae bacterium]MCK6382630.1 thioredoxin family protein [Leptospiraceae bacterium]NUM42503.1 thioredoxin family protein [Leptospiraceae bacterium]